MIRPVYVRVFLCVVGLFYTVYKSLGVGKLNDELWSLTLVSRALHSESSSVFNAVNTRQNVSWFPSYRPLSLPNNYYIFPSSLLLWIYYKSSNSCSREFMAPNPYKHFIALNFSYTTLNVNFSLRSEK